MKKAGRRLGRRKKSAGEGTLSEERFSLPRTPSFPKTFMWQPAFPSDADPSGKGTVRLRAGVPLRGKKTSGKGLREKERFPLGRVPSGQKNSSGPEIPLRVKRFPLRHRPAPEPERLREKEGTSGRERFPKKVRQSVPQKPAVNGKTLRGFRQGGEPPRGVLSTVEKTAVLRKRRRPARRNDKNIRHAERA